MCSQISSYRRMPFSQGHIMGEERRVFLWEVGRWWFQMCIALGSLQAAFKTKDASQSLSCIRKGGKKQSKRGGAETQCWEGWKGQLCSGPLANRAHSCRAAAVISQVIAPSHSFPCRMGCLPVTTPPLLTLQDWVLGAVKAGGVIKLTTIKEKNHWSNKQVYSAQDIQHWALGEHSAR